MLKGILSLSYWSVKTRRNASCSMLKEIVLLSHFGEELASFLDIDGIAI